MNALEAAGRKDETAAIFEEFVSSHLSAKVSQSWIERRWEIQILETIPNTVFLSVCVSLSLFSSLFLSLSLYVSIYFSFSLSLSPSHPLCLLSLSHHHLPLTHTHIYTVWQTHPLTHILYHPPTPILSHTLPYFLSLPKAYFPAFEKDPNLSLVLSLTLSVSPPPPPKHTSKLILILSHTLPYPLHYTRPVFQYLRRILTSEVWAWLATVSHPGSGGHQVLRERERERCGGHPTRRKQN